MALNYDVEYPKLLREYHKQHRRIEELETENTKLNCKLQNYRLGSGWTESDRSEMIDTIERLDAALAEIEKIANGNGSTIVMSVKISDIARKARAGK